MKRKMLEAGILIAALAFWMTGCDLFFGSDSASSSSGSAPASIAISGTLGATTNSSASSDIARADTILALPIDVPFIASPYLFDQSLSAEINSDGTFELSLSGGDLERRWLLMLVDTGASTRRESFVAFAALGDTEENLLLVPADAASNDIEMGTLEPEGNEAADSSALESNERTFELSLVQLRQLAQMDNMLKTVWNLYVNSESGSGEHATTGLPHWWTAERSTVRNAFADPGSFIYQGYQPHFNFQGKGIDFTSIADQSDRIDIVPPGAVETLAGSSYVSFHNQGSWDEKRDDYALDNTVNFAVSLDERGNVQMSAGGERFVNSPDGYWEVLNNGDRVALFDLNVASPFYEETGAARLFLPSVKVVTGSDDIVSGFEVAWFRYDQAVGEYVRVTDLSDFARLTEWVGFYYVETNGEEVIFDPSSPTETVFQPSVTLRFFESSATDGHVLERIFVGYRIFGVDYALEIR